MGRPGQNEHKQRKAAAFKRGKDGQAREPAHLEQTRPFSIPQKGLFPLKLR